MTFFCSKNNREKNKSDEGSEHVRVQLEAADKEGAPGRETLGKKMGLDARRHGGNSRKVGGNVQKIGFFARGIREQSRGHALDRTSSDVDESRVRVDCEHKRFPERNQRQEGSTPFGAAVQANDTLRASLLAVPAQLIVQFCEFCFYQRNC